MMLATLVQANPGTAQALFLVAALVFVLAFVVEALRGAAPTWLLALAAWCVLSLGLLFLS